MIKEEEHSPIDTDILIKGLDQLVNEVHLVEDFYQRHKNFVCLHASQDKIYRSEVSSSLPKDHFIEVGKCHASQWTDSQQLAYIIEDYF